jgi:formate-dependent nitrite reductase membrane component NrfD
MLRHPSLGDQEALVWYLWLISIAIAVAIAAVCYRVAESNGRNGVLWAILGFIFPIVALVVLFILSAKDKTRNAV